MAGLTFVNQIGAVEGMNQAAPGTLIPESFVRFSQDVLFDRAGLMRRRGPFEKFKMYNANNQEDTLGLFDSAIASVDNERVLAVLSTYDPTGAERIGMLVDSQDGSNHETVLRVFDNSFRFLGYEKLPFDVAPLSIVSVKPALGGGVWVSIVDDPADANTHYQFFWRGGYSSKTSSITGTFTRESVSNVSTEHQAINKVISVSTTNNVNVGQFVYATYSGNDYYIGTVSAVDDTNLNVTLEKRPIIWQPNVDNNHYIFLTPNRLTYATGVATVRVNEAMLFEVGDVVYMNTSNAGYNDTNPHTITAIDTAPAVGLQTFSYALATTQSTDSAPTGNVYMNNDLSTISMSGVSLKFVSVRPYAHTHGRGLISIEDPDANDIVSGSAGTSADGHWQAANVTNYNLYRSSDNFYIGKVKEVANNYTATLWADSGLKLEGEEYIMRSNDATDLINDFRVGSATNTPNNFAGLYTAVYAGYQWYGNFAQDDQNTNRVVFSASHDREAVDLSLDAADSIIFPGKSKFRGLGSSSAGLLVFLEDRTYMLRGNDRTNFSIEQLVPEGCLCASSIVEYGGGVFWAGKSGIMYFDGASVRNLTKDNLGLYYPDSLDVFNPEQDRVIGFMHKNNLIMHYTAWKAPFDPIRYEPIYASDWQNTEGIANRGWDEFDPDYDYDDFFTENNTPIFWDQKKLNNPEESSSSGEAITWQATPTTYTVTNKVASSGTATLTVGSHSLIVGDKVFVSGVDATFNGQYTITAKTSTTISYAKTGTVSSQAATGSVYKTRSTWGTPTNINKWGPLRKNTSMTFCIYMPTNALTTLSNMDPRGVTSVETIYGLKTIVGVNSVESAGLRARLIDIHPVFDLNTNGSDEFLVEKININTADLVRGPDFYLQTKHFTVGDPILRKWFQRIMISMLLYDGAIRMDLVDDDDNDSVDVNKKKHKYWEIFTEKGYDWDYLTNVQFPKIVSPNRATWKGVEGSANYWDELFTADFNRYSKRISWRKPSVGFRLYQLNDYKKPFNGVVTTPNRVDVQGFSVGFKPLRQGRV